jgi:uncharacterized membrane protein
MAEEKNHLFTPEEEKIVTDAIKQAELNTSGEIRVHIENYSKDDVLDRAAYWFAKLGMHKTKERNGVLFYLAVDARKFAILGDVGINTKVPEGFWEKIKDTMVEYFKQGKFAEGLTKGILMAGEQLKKYFPHQKDDINELSDEISYDD